MHKKRGQNFLINSHSTRGQVTIFIILAVIIIGAAALIYFLYPQIKATITGTQDPQSYIQTCLQNEIKSTVKTLSLQGGSISPGHYFTYYNDWDNDAALKSLYGVQTFHIEYLCYTNKDLQPCVMQQPLLQAHIEDEIKTNIQSTLDSCFSNLQKSFQSKGYSTNLVPGTTIVDLLPGRIIVTSTNQLTLTKGNSQTYNEFKISVNSNLYELTGIASSVLQWEVQEGDANTPLFMMYYPNLLLEKKLQTDGTKVYILIDLNTNDVFQFATRSYAWPPGYGGNQ